MLGEGVPDAGADGGSRAASVADVRSGLCMTDVTDAVTRAPPGGGWTSGSQVKPASITQSTRLDV